MRRVLCCGNAIYMSLFFVLSMMLSAPTYAGALQQLKMPKGVDTSGDIITILQGIAGKAVLVIVGLIGFAGFVMVAWSALHKFQECVHGKANWGTLGLIIVVGIVVLLFDSVLLYLGYQVFTQ